MGLVTECDRVRCVCDRHLFSLVIVEAVEAVVERIGVAEAVVLVVVLVLVDVVLVVVML